MQITFNVMYIIITIIPSYNYMQISNIIFIKKKNICTKIVLEKVSLINYKVEIPCPQT